MKTKTSTPLFLLRLLMLTGFLSTASKARLLENAILIILLTLLREVNMLSKPKSIRSPETVDLNTEALLFSNVVVLLFAVLSCIYICITKAFNAVRRIIIDNSIINNTEICINLCCNKSIGHYPSFIYKMSSCIR